MPKVSVVIPAYNMARYLGEAIESLLAQTCKDLEIIVVDDGSTDETAAVCARYPVKYIHQENHGCCGSARNTALHHSSGDYIAFLDADDRSKPQRIEKQVAFLEKHPSVGLVYTNFRNFSENLGEWPTQYEECPLIRARLTNGSCVLPPVISQELLLEENYALPSTLMIRRKVLTFVPGFTSQTNVGEDIFFAYLVARRWDTGLLDFIGTERRVHSSNISGDPVRFLAGGIMTLRMLMASEKHPLLRMKIEARVQRMHVSLSRVYSNDGEFTEAVRCAIEARSPRMLARALLLSGIRKIRAQASAKVAVVAT